MRREEAIHISNEIEDKRSKMPQHKFWFFWLKIGTLNLVSKSLGRIHTIL